VSGRPGPPGAGREKREEEPGGGLVGHHERMPLVEFGGKAPSGLPGGKDPVRPGMNIPDGLPG